jgi:hypothetical protein
VKGVSEPDAETGVILAENLRYIIISDELSPMELREHPLSEGFLNRFEVYLQEPSKTKIGRIQTSALSLRSRARRR